MTNLAGVYCRISQDREGAGLGVRRQEAECRDLALRSGWEVAEVYVDNDTSAYKGKRRPGYERLLSDVQEGRLDAVLAWHVDRLHRSPVELERYISVMDPRRIPTLTVKAGDLDLSTATGRMTARIVGAVSRGESEQKAERLSSQRRQAQADGKWLGGRRPFGYDDDALHLHGAEAPLLLEASQAVLSGESLHAVARAWNEAGITTTAGGRWNAANLRNVLLRPRNAGLAGNRGRIIGDGAWEPIVPRETWDALCAKLTDPSRQTHTSTSRKLLGSFLFLCGVCGQRVGSGGHGPNGQNRYGCPESHMRRSSEAIDDLVRSVVAARLQKEGVALMPPSEDMTFQRDRLAVLRARSEEIASMFADGDMDGAQFKIANGKVQGEITALEGEIGRRSSSSALAGIADAVDAGDAFLSASIDRQRLVIDALCTVTILRVGPGRRTDGIPPEESIRVEWKSD